jgi:bla regulator protein BlaR1
MNENIKNALRTSKQSPLIIINGKESNRKELSLLQPENIENVNIIKEQNAISEYGDKAKYGIIDITLKEDKEIPSKEENKKEIEIEIIESANEYIYWLDGKQIETSEVANISAEKIKTITVYTTQEAKEKLNINSNGKKVMEFSIYKEGEINTTSSKELIKHQISLQNKNSLIILNGKEITRRQLSELNPDQIKSIFTLKGEKAIEKFGERAEDGAIVISTK